MSKNFDHYPSTAMFWIKDTIGVPHPYCIGSRHVGWAADHFSGLLGKEAILDAERHGIKCCTCKGKLSYEQHEQALLVAVNDPENRELKDVPGLQEYLLSIKEQCEKDGYAGFAFIKA